MEKTIKLLKIDRESLTEKCAGFSVLYVKELLGNKGQDIDRQILIDYITKTFSNEETIALIMYMLLDSTSKGIKNKVLEGLENDLNTQQ